MAGFVKTLKVLNKIFFILSIIVFFIGFGLSILEMKPDLLSTTNTSNTKATNNYSKDYGGNGSYVPSHSHNYTVSQIVNPTCTAQGYTVYKCNKCDHQYNGNYINSLGHEYAESGVPVGNCALSMKQGYVCTRCDSAKSESVTAQAPDAHNHLNAGDTCEFCGWQVYMKNDNSVLMINDDSKLSAEYYGQSIYNFGSNKAPYITNVYLYDSVTSIGNSAFYNCSSLTSITIPDSVTSIGESAFQGCSSLTSITIPDSVTSIGNCAFLSCSSLTSITIPDSVTSIGNCAFLSCSSLTSITIPDSVTSIGDGAFEYCSSLTSITIPDSVTSIDSSAFYCCSGLTSITIGNSVTSIKCSSSGASFSSCSGLTSVYYTGTASEWARIEGLGYIMDLSRTLYINNEPVTDVVLENITVIKPYAFSSCSGLTSITIPNSVTSIGRGAFAYCSSLTSITFNGTKAKWNAINKENNWDSGVSLTCKINCTDGTLNI